MQKLITRYGLAAHLAFLAVAPLFLTPVCVLWLSLLGFTWLLMEPSRIGNENVHLARRRVFGRITHDLLFWVMLVVVLAAGVCWMNGGVAMAYDAENARWFIRQPQFPLLPGSAVGHGCVEFAATLAFAVVVVGCRHALGRFGRQAFLSMVAIYTGILGLVMAYSYFDGSEVVASLAKFGLENPVYPGVAFGLGTMVSIAAISSAFELVWRKIMLLLAVAFAGNLAALVMFAPLWTVVVFLAASLVIFAYAFIFDRKKVSGHGEFKFVVFIGIGLALASVVSVAVISEKTLMEKAESVQQRKIFPEEYKALRNSMSQLSLRAWKENLWLGTGLGSFQLNMRFNATGEDWQTIPPNQSAPLNGYWHLLVERGIVGAILASAVLLMLLVTYFRRLVIGVRCALPPPSAFVGLLAIAAVLTLAAADCSYTYPGILIITASTLAVSAGSFPKEKSNG